jgi:peroxiredoxin
MMMKSAALGLALTACLLPGVAPAMVGTPAPALTVQQWVKGPAVEVKPGTNIFVVEIWETASPSAPAVTAMLTDLQRRFLTNGVVVVGICDEKPDEIKAFAGKETTNLNYSVAADDHRQTSLNYMNAANQRGLPYAFIVGTNGNVLWHGWSPRALAETLEQVVAGQYDEKQAKKIEVASHQMQQYLKLVRANDPRTAAAGRTLLENRTNDAPLLCDLAMEIVSMEHLPRRDLKLADAALTQAEQIQGTNNDRLLYARAMFLFQSGHVDAALAHATQAVEFAQSPRDKAAIEAGIRLMHARIEAAQKAHNKPAPAASSTNAIPAAAGQTNQTKASVP